MNISSLGKSACILLLSCFSFSTTAATLNVDGGGNLLGAFGVDVGGSLYDVEFVDGSCIDLFAGCDEQSDFVFQNEQDAITAAEALLSQVFIDSIEGQFDSLPSLSRGCSFSGFCNARTPFNLFEEPIGSWSVRSALAQNYDDVGHCCDGVVIGDASADLDLGAGRVGLVNVYVVWQPAPIPAPAALVLFGSALAGMAGLRLTRKDNTA